MSPSPRVLPTIDYSCWPKPHINVACLYLEFFAAMLAGTKDCEYRTRCAHDPILERVEEGEPVIFYESRTPRCLGALIWEIQKEVLWPDRRIEYRFFLEIEDERNVPQLLPFNWPLKFRPQGWSRWTREQLRRKGIPI